LPISPFQFEINEYRMAAYENEITSSYDAGYVRNVFRVVARLFFPCV
jgi:hypothetical protein